MHGIGDLARGAVEAAKDAVPAAGAVGAAQVGGAVLGAPSWMLGLGQAVIVVYFTLRGVDRRQRERDSRLAEVEGKIDRLRGEFRALPCSGGPALTPCPSQRLVTLGGE